MAGRVNVSKFESNTKEVNGLLPSSSETGEIVKCETHKARRIESEVISYVRIAEALCEEGNVTLLIAALEKLQGCGVTLNSARVIEMIERALDNHAKNDQAANA